MLSVPVPAAVVAIFMVKREILAVDNIKITKGM